MADRGSPGRGSSPAGPFEAGTLLGKYEILKRLATGGMAEIYLARVSGPSGIRKMVVVKRILPQLADKADFVEMFLDEARIVATLEHPNVVQLYDVGVVERNYFIAMEYLHGEDVRSMAKALARNERKLPLEHALNVLIGVAAGLHYAHEKVGFDGKPLKIVHRDVNPQNVIVTYNGAVKLLDFGIAKASNRLNETRLGTLKGKVPYMSPEQCRGESLDRRSDLFSLGIMLYELTLGRQLFPGKSDFDVLKQIVEGTVVPPREIDPTYSPALDAIVMRALEKDKDKRYQTAREMQIDLEALVWEARLHVSPNGLAQFMEELFVDKIDAWRAAQSRGETLGDHLQTVTHAQAGQEDDDAPLIEITEDDAEQVAAERAAFRARIEAASDADVRALRPTGGMGTWALAVLALLAAIGGIAWYARGMLLPSAKQAAMDHRARPPSETELPAPAVPSEVAERPRPPTPEPEPQPQPQPAGLKVSTAPAGATLFLDGKQMKDASPTIVSGVLTGREHVLLASLAGYKSMAVRFTLAANETRLVALKLKRSAGKPEPLSSVLPHAPRSLPPPPPVPATSGASTSTVPAVSAPMAPPRVAPMVSVAPAPARQELPDHLEGEGTLMLASSPWCNVSVDGVVKGATPLSVKLPAGKHTVVLTNPEFKITRTLPVTILPDETVRKRLDFAQ